MQHVIVHDGLQNQVVVIDATVDPERDKPSRLLAYEKYTGVDWTLLTGTAQHLAKLWKYFGASYERVADGKPAGIDWQTGKPYTYDIDHSNDVFLFNRSGHERLLTQGLPNVAASCRPTFEPFSLRLASTT